MKKGLRLSVFSTIVFSLVVTLVLSGCEEVSKDGFESSATSETISAVTVSASEDTAEEANTASSVDTLTKKQADTPADNASKDTSETDTDTTDASDENTGKADEDTGKSETEAGQFTFAKIDNRIMYTTTELYVRDMPSVEGTAIGSLCPNQEVTVTGRCNETGWYQIVKNGNTGYVSDEFLSDTKIVSVADENQAIHKNHAEAYSQTPAQEPTNVLVIPRGDGTFDVAIENMPADWTEEQALAWIENWYLTNPSAQQIVAQAMQQSASLPVQTQEPYFDRAMAEAVWAAVNAERSANGLAQLAWDEGIYEFACQRAQALVNDFSHNGCGNYGENILASAFGSDANTIHSRWYNSEGHHMNYLKDFYTAGACAVYHAADGTVYAVENFYAEGYHY